MAPAIEIDGLRKEYRTSRRGRTVAIDGLDLEVPAGGVFGFLGPNGSGKTTTIRCVLGLARATRGSVRLFDRRVPEGLNETIRHVGAIVESPALLPTLTGRDNLAELLKTLSPDDEATLGLAMRVAAPLLDELKNVAANNPPSNVFAPRRASVRA